MTQAEDLHALTSAEVARQSREYQARRTEVVRELAAMFAARQKGNAPEPAPLPEPARKARERAKEMLNGHSPANFTLPPSVSRESELEIEKSALDLVLDALSKSEISLRAAESLQWAEDHAQDWRTLCREQVLTMCRLHALEAAAQRFVDKAYGASLPMREFVGYGLSIDVPGYHPSTVAERAVKAAREAGLITSAEAREAADVAFAEKGKRNGK